MKEGILHADQDVREAAVHYFANSHSADSTIMSMVIQTIEKFGFDKAFETYGFLENLVQTDETVRWLIQQLGKLAKSTDEKAAELIQAYTAALVHADATILQNHESEIVDMDSLDPDALDVIAQRIRYLSRPSEELWDVLEEFCQNLEDDEFAADENYEFGCRLVEALGRFPDRYADKVLEDDGVTDGLQQSPGRTHLATTGP